MRKNEYRALLLVVKMAIMLWNGKSKMKKKVGISLA